MTETPPAFSVKKHADLPIMMTKFEEHFAFAQDALPYTVAVKQFLDAQENPVYYLFDLTNWHVMSFGELMQAAAQAARGKDSNFHHPMNKYTLLVTNDKLVSKSAEGMSSAVYANANVKVFNSVEDALAFVNEQPE